MNFKHLESEDKLRGGFYTPETIADCLSRWVLNGGARSILEPGCGDGSFLRSIYKFLKVKLDKSELTIDAVEILHKEAEKARNVAAEIIGTGVSTSIIESDFLEWILKKSSSQTWDAIVGNPPYIRYQYFDAKQRDFAAKIFADANMPFTKRTNAWVPFVIASIMHLSPGGRLAMVLPAEILHILHSEGLRRIIEQEMDVVEIIDVRELVFEDALQGVVLLRAIKKNREFLPLQTFSKYGVKQLLLNKSKTEEVEGEAATFYIHHLDNLQDVLELNEINNNNKELHVLPYGKWTRWLLEPSELNLLSKIEKQPWALPFVDIADVDIGIVTGANNYFVVDTKTAEKYDLTPFTSPMLARSEFIKGVTYTLEDQVQNEKDGKAVLFVKFPSKPFTELPGKVVDYLKIGEEREIHERYKCRIREPWYVVPYVWISNLSMLKRCHDFPRLVMNEAQALSTDTAYRIVMKNEYQERGYDFVFSFLNSLTLLYTELEGRHYGGGVLELVPSEIEVLRVPLTRITRKQFEKLDTMVRQNANSDEILDYTDPIILGRGSTPNLSDSEISLLRQARKRLRDRRLRCKE